MKKGSTIISELILVLVLVLLLMEQNKSYLNDNLKFLENQSIYLILISVSVIFLIIKLISIYKYLNSLFDTFSKFSSEESNNKDLIKEEVKEGHYEEFYTNRNPKFYGFYYKGKLSGDTKEFFENGQIKETGHFKEGKKDGVFISFNESGIKKEKLIFDRGVLCEKRIFTNKPFDGIRNFYDWGGRILGSISCENEFQGVFESYYENGQIKVKATYNNGTRNKHLFYESQSTLFKESISKGTWLSYFENGQLKAKGIFVDMIDIDNENFSSETLFDDSYLENLRKIGIWEYYHENGNLKSNINYDESNFVSFFDDGFLETRGKYKNSKKVDFWEHFHENENLQSKGNYEDDRAEGYWEHFHENENLQSKGNYQSHMQDGYWEYYHENGQLQSKGNFDYNTQVGYWEYYYENGQLKSKGNYVEDTIYDESSKIGCWEYYHENGQLESKGNYENDIKFGYWEYYNENGKSINFFGKFLFKIKMLFNTGRKEDQN
jgi:antitoxin component YwqK of YwqJK toxin-antitoxin module